MTPLQRRSNPRPSPHRPRHRSQQQPRARRPRAPSCSPTTSTIRGPLAFPGDGFVRLYRYNDGTATPMTDGIASAAVRRGNETNRLELGCAGPTISATVNGTRVAAVGDGTFQQGQMRVSAFASRATVQ